LLSPLALGFDDLGRFGRAARAVDGAAVAVVFGRENFALIPDHSPARGFYAQ
jgi:hypothetical protein